MLIPKDGTLERVLLEAMLKAGDKGLTFHDLAGTGITEDNIEQIARNLETGMFEAENDTGLRRNS